MLDASDDAAAQAAAGRVVQPQFLPQTIEELDLGKVALPGTRFKGCQFPRLRVLHLLNVSDEGVSAAAAACPCLEMLHVSGGNLSDRALGVLDEACHALQWLRGCLDPDTETFSDQMIRAVRFKIGIFGMTW